jgi:uncharacterized protein YciI
MVVSHVAVSTAPDYPARREPHRQRHLERLMGLRAAGVLIGGGPAPDGRRVDLFYRTERPEDVQRLVEDDPYTQGGAWTGHRATAFANFLEPWRQVPLVTDGSRRATIVEGLAADVDMATFALIEARGAGQMAFGGFFPRGATLAVMAMADEDEALAILRNSGFWAVDSLAARPWLYVL